MRLRSADGGLWSGRKVAEVMAAHLGLERVLSQRGWEALKALGRSLQRPRPKNSATSEDVFSAVLPVSPFLYFAKAMTSLRITRRSASTRRSALARARSSPVSRQARIASPSAEASAERTR